MLRLLALVLGLTGCAHPLKPPAPPAALTAGEISAWSRYLESVERFLAQPTGVKSGLAVLELRARLAENLAALSRDRLPLPEALSARAAQFLARLDALFVRTVQEAAASVPSGSTGPSASASASGPLPGEKAPVEPEAEAEVSEAEIDDGGPAVDIVLPPAPPGSLFRWPVSPVRVTSGFGYRRDPLSGRVGFHDGLDLSVPRGTPVLAASGGRVTFAGGRGGGGNMVVVGHAPGVKTVYAHLDRILVAPGTNLAAGETLGLAGSTGRATGPHLHFVVRIAGRPVNPLFLVGQGAEALSALGR
jgi:murein DD-endopeptidase MepM/ murein hydrolase activator NlpD